MHPSRATKYMTRRYFTTLAVLALLTLGLLAFMGDAEACACGGTPLTPEETAQAQKAYADSVALYHNRLDYDQRAYRAYTFWAPPGFYYGYAYYLIPIPQG